MSKFYTLSVASVERETPDSVLITFDVPDALREVFGYKAGQYLTLEADIDGEPVRRAYSLCTAPEESVWQVGIKRVPGGKFSVFANEKLRPGDTLRVMPPQGNFTLPGGIQDGHRSYVAFAAGSGITPVMSILKHTLMSVETASFILFYGNKTSEDVMFRETLEQLKNQFLGRLSIHHFFSREQTASPLFHGRIDAAKVRQLAGRLFDPSTGDLFFACGPGEMVVEVKDTLKELGVPEEALKYELFTPAGEKKGAAKASARAEVKPTLEKVKLIIELDGDDFSLEVDPRLSILDDGLLNDLDLPYACKAGICCTCKAKVIEGEVKMERADSLDQDEIDAGYILTCQAFPASETVKVDFDV